ncbi:uncharacterized protein J7T55_010406 [Diaporthe amygdali]|uniref:uncharacterized protein n=1 Tax=Phomopsis amygdali TaxID=1214568 RepID=UPI0022FED185|nr:uncharacterized protein J7T55_010406 [Diaporthe amygdali]KAJ0115583.1 uncharacterized protein J7T55_010406 [Diaporthe amygdali]
MQITSSCTAFLLAIAGVEAAGYIAFYSDSGCNNQVGSVHYSLHNNGCFANGGSYMKVVSGEDDPTQGHNFVLTQSKASGCTGGVQLANTYDGQAVNVCRNLGGDGYITGGNGQDHPYSVRLTE